MLKKIKSFYQNANRLHFLFFLMGVFGGLLFYFKTEDTYEVQIFKSLAIWVNESTADDKNEADKLLAGLHLVHNALGNRQTIFADGKLNESFKASFLQPLSVDLMTAQGACGSYALVMARLMKDLGFEARMIQMKVGEEYGGHNIVEVKTNGDWVVVDPLYDLCFTSPNGNLASFKDVQDNWEYYKLQVPQSYDMRYRYEDARYTNWNKIPVILPAIKKMLDWTLGIEKSNSISLRIAMMRKFNIFFICTLIFQILIIIYTVVLIRQKNKMLAILAKPDQEQNTNGIINIIRPSLTEQNLKM